MNRFNLFILILPMAVWASEYPFVCEWKDISQFASNRYEEVSGTPWNPAVVIDKQTISIDKSNGIVKVWEIDLASRKGREEVLKHFQGDKDDYGQYGYTKTLMVYKYKSLESKGLLIARYNCDGNTITSVKNPNTSTSDGFNYILPGTEGEYKLNEIKRFYNLK